MSMNDKPAPKPEEKPPRARRRIIEKYAAGLRELIRKLRQKLDS
jgi:hypothetical protein